MERSVVRSTLSARYITVYCAIQRLYFLWTSNEYSSVSWNRVDSSQSAAG